MDHCFKGLILALSLCSSTAFAGYAQAVPPAGWGAAPAGSGASGGFTGTAANNATFRAGSVATNASMNVGGRSVSIPATMRFAANAPRYAAAAVMMHPTVRGFATIAAWLGAAGLVYDAASGLWGMPNSDYPVSDGYVYHSRAPYVDGQTFHSPSALCAASIAELRAQNPAYSFSITACSIETGFKTRGVYNESGAFSDYHYTIGRSLPPSSCPSGWYVTPAGCVQSPPPAFCDSGGGNRRVDKAPHAC